MDGFADDLRFELSQFVEEAYKLDFSTEDITQGGKIFSSTRFSIGKLLGQGGFGYVYELKDSVTGSSYAMKIILKSHKKFSIIKDEAKIQKKLKHPNIMAIDFLFDSEDYIAMIMELAEGDLFDYAQENEINWKDAVKILKEISGAVFYIHGQGYAHRDIKRENIMEVSRDGATMKSTASEDGARIRTEGKVWKLIDFGFAVSAEETLKSPCSTLDYTAPEAIETAYGNVEFYTGQPTDIWTLGILLYELIYGKPPFYRKSYKATYEAIRNEKVVFPGTPEDVPENVKSLIEKILDKNPKTRIKIEDVLKNLEEL